MAHSFYLIFLKYRIPKVSGGKELEEYCKSNIIIIYSLPCSVLRKHYITWKELNKIPALDYGA